jgi:hypothetical protein
MWPVEMGRLNEEGITMQWNNEIQRSILGEWMDGVDKCRTDQQRRGLRKRIAKKYGLTIYMVQGIIELGALQGLNQIKGNGEMHGGGRYEPINYHELVKGLEERVAALERKFNYLLEGIDRVIEDGETMRIHVQHLRGIAKWARKRDAIDLEDKPTLSISSR